MNLLVRRAFAISVSAALIATGRPAYADEAGADLAVKVSATSATTGPRALAGTERRAGALEFHSPGR